jgi:YVTN family beta-propeller protein
MRSKPFASAISRTCEIAPRPALASFKLAAVALSLLILFASHAGAQQQQQQENRAGDSPRAAQRYTREGVAVEFSVEPSTGTKATELLEGTEATVKLKIADSNTGKPLSNLRPVGWIGHRGEGKTLDEKGCHEKVQSFLQASLTDRPEIDLNSYFILALNQEANISVIDPLSGFGSTKLYTLVALRSPGEDWVMSGDKKRLYVSMPLVNQVAVVDTAAWKVVANIDTGINPARLVLQHDGKYLWAGNDSQDAAKSGVTVIDTTTLKVATQLATGAGHHEIVLADDDRYAFVTNKQSGSVTVVDVRGLTKVKDLKVGSLPTALAFSSLSRAVYIANEGDGTIVAVDGSRHEITTRLETRAGLRAVRILPGGRFGFAVNGQTNSVHIFDVSTNRMIQVVPVGPAPDQISFTRDFAYVRSRGNEFVTMIKITDLAKEGREVAVSRFPAGQLAPQTSSYTSLADAVIPAPEEGAVLVANPADKTIYYYTEGMAAPMGSFQNYRRDPKAVLVLNNSLSETSPGVYTVNVRLPRKGHYDLAFLLSTPRVVNCFDFTVQENPALPDQDEVAIKVEPLLDERTARVGETYNLRFKVSDAATNRPNADLKDMGVLVFLTPGIWQQRAWAKPVGGGVYEMSFVPPQAGVYFIFFQCPSLGIRFNQLPRLILQATKTDAATVTSETQKTQP